jgi:hypothetical protein
VTAFHVFGATAFQILIVALLVVIATGVFILIARWRFLESRPRYERYWRERWPGGRTYPLWEIIERAEAEAGVVLTWGAREMLSIPVVETMELRGDINWSEVDASVRDILRTMAEETQRQRPRPARTRDSVSVIRGFARRFCNIPPFCSRDDERPG